ncbi:MAG: exosortase/archaeosortase family protein [Candidatus Eisenbacteria bacterium]
MNRSGGHARAHSNLGLAARPALPAGAQAVVLSLLFALVHHRTFSELWGIWTTNDNYSHGPLVPMTSAILVAMRWRKFEAIPFSPDARGLALIALSCLMQVVGIRADLFALQCWSVLPLLFGLSLTFLGRARTHMLTFPIAYLAFMFTFPPFIMNQLSYALKEIAMAGATRGAEWLGVTLHRAGMSLYLVSGELRVENPCSGLRSLLALLATATMFAYFQPGGLGRRAAMMLGAIPIAILGNAARLLLLIVAAHYRSVEWATGAFHDVTGYVIYAVALAALLVLRSMLSPVREGRASALQRVRGLNP